MKPIDINVILLITFFISVHLSAQEKVHGVITAFDSIPRVGVEIQVKSARKIMKTDSSGRLSVDAKNMDKLKWQVRDIRV